MHPGSARDLCQWQVCHHPVRRRPAMRRLPLVNKAGTSITCDTPQDAEARIANTGATGGLVGKRDVQSRAAFTLQNGQDAQALNKKFQTLTPDSACTASEQACIQGQLGTCVGGKFALTPCAGGLQCVALPLVNKAGTSITCDTTQDAEARIANTGATGGLVGKRDVQRRAAFTLQNGLDAQALNKKFQTLTPDSACTASEQACIQGQLGTCVGGKFSLTPCAGGLQCVALPLVNKAGTSITCDTTQDAEARIANTGATGGLVGKRDVQRRAAFTLQNGQDAQALNKKFQTLTPDSACTASEQACIQGQLGTCVGGKFSLTPCAGGLQCVALPLVNKAGTSITCDTTQDAEARIANTGATGGLVGKRDVQRRAAFTLQNGQDAQALNKKFQTLTPDSACTASEQACIQGQLGTCVGGKFALTPCAGGLQCVALPLVNKAGTSITCDTTQDAEARIANTGATGGLVGKRDVEGRGLTRRVDAPPACKAKAKRDEPRQLLKRIAQTDLGQVAQSWQDLCVKSGGARDPANDPCVVLAGKNGISALLANADACAQQDNADAMVDFAKQPGIKNKQALIDNAVAFRKHPRNALDINGVVPSTLFCEKAPRNPELAGVANGQLQGVDPGVFGSPSAGVVAFGAPGTCPFGQKADVATCTCN
ncbi:hypothetical protein BC826DRAFT_587708 [Russula brevipes]|nr:hypothetical protein BC826DRAFT_587708 [Russula brevipes]